MNSSKTCIVFINTSAGSRAERTEGPKWAEKQSVVTWSIPTLATPGFKTQLSHLVGG